MSEDNISTAIRDSSKFPITARAKLAFDYRDKLEKEWDNKEKCAKLNRQSKGINNIKKLIAQRKRDFLCHQNERFKTKFRKQQEIENTILTKHNLSLKNENVRKQIANKLILYNKTQNMKMQKQKERMLKIVQKIATEYDWKEQDKNKKKVEWKPRKKIVPESFVEEEEEFSEIVEEEEWEELPEQKPKTKPKKEPKQKPPKSPSGKKAKSIPEKKPKTPKEPKRPKDEFIMPEAPITNPRIKIKPDETQKLSGLLEPLQKLDKFIDDEIKYYEKQPELPVNKNFGATPSCILFEDFENDKEYKKKIHINNLSSEIYHCKYEDIKSNDDFASVAILVEEVGVQKVLPGCSYPLIIYFLPKEIKYLEGELIFTTQKPGKAEFSQFSVHFKCETGVVKLNIAPKNVIFKSLPIWEVDSNAETNFKVVEVQNNMARDCILVIRKSETIIDEYESEKNVEVINKDESEGTIKLLINDCFEQISNVFHFSSYFYSLPPKSLVYIKIFLKHAPFVGALQEVFEFEFVRKVNKEFSILYSEKVLIQAEITGKFIATNIDYIDYNICILNSVYQASFNVYNYGISPVKLGFQYPTKLKEYFTAYPATFYLRPYNHETISLKFIPRKEILSTQMTYFDQYTNILSCPIKIIILSSKPSIVPPTILTVYAILTEPDFIKLRFTSCDMLQEDGYPVLNLGEVTTHETVVADFEIENISPVAHEFGFFHLPEVINILPNYGFGVIQPHETKKLQICLSPTAFDLITDECIHSSGPLNVFYTVTCTTVHKIGGVPKKKPKEKLKKYENLETQFNKTYMGHIDEYIASNISSGANLETPLPVAPNSENLDEEEYIFEEDLEEETKITKQLSIIVKATLVDYWTELSHQFVIFPDTPLGSQTTMDILFSCVNNSTVSECTCGFVNANKMADFSCHFEVTGGDNDISIEPICGDLKKGQSVHLLLTARPTVENQILKQTAAVVKHQRLLAEKAKKKAGKKEKPAKKGAEPIVNDNVSLYNCDYYPAEKEVAKSLRPYVTKAKFYFVVTFPKYLNKQDEILYLTTKCRIIRPDFVTNLPTQFINFGTTAIQTRPKKIISLENISRRIIEPKISPLNPSGPFICATQIQNKLEREHLLKIPVTFAPTDEIFYKEYFEIKSGNTIETVMVSGEGVTPVFDIIPKFSVCRITAKLGKSADCVFAVDNKCRAPLILYLKKVCELKGKIVPKPIPKEEKTEKVVKGKKDNKSDKASKASKKSQKVKKFSEDLTIDEEYSLDNFFVPFEGESRFKLMSTTSTEFVTIEPLTKPKIKIRFETPKPVVEKSTEKKGKGDKSSKASSRAASSKAPKEKLEKGAKFVAKYNVMLGNVVLVSDFIIIAEFQ